MSLVQQLLNSNVRAEGSSSRFKFVSRSPRFSSGSSAQESNFSDELRRQLSPSSSREIIQFERVEYGKDRSGENSGSRDENFLKHLASGGEESSENSFGRADGESRGQRIQSSLEERVKNQRKLDREDWSPAKESGIAGGDPGNSAEQQGSSVSSTARSETSAAAGEEEAGFTEEEKRLLKKLENGEVDLSDEEEVGRLKELLQSVKNEDSNPEKTRKVMKTLQNLFSEPSKFLQQLQGQNADELKSSVEGLTDLLKSFRKVAGESKKQTTQAFAEKVKGVLEELDLGESTETETKGGTSGLEELLSGSEVTIEFDGAKSSRDSSNSGSDSKDSSPTEKLKKTLGKVIDGLEKLSQQLSGKGDGSASVSPGEAVEKIKSFLESIKQSLNGSGSSSENSSGTGFLGKQTQQVLDELDRTIQDEDLRKKIKAKLEKMRASTDGKNSSETEEKETKTQSGSQESKSSESGKKKADGDGSEKNAKSENSKGSKSSSSSAEASGQQSDQSSSSNNEKAKAAQDASKTEQANQSGEGSDDARERTAKSSQSEEASSKEQKKGDQKASKGSDSKSSSAQSKNSKGPTPTAEEVKEKASESSKETKSNGNTSGKKTGSDTGKKSKSNQGKKVKTAAVKNQPDKAESSSKPSGESTQSKNQSSETSRLKTSDQSFETAEKKVQQASRSKDVVADKGDVKRDGVKTKAASNSRTDKLASFETNTARAVDANEQSGTSFSNGGNSNGNSGNLSTNVKSQVASYTQRSPEARKMINQIVERAQTMLKDGKQSMRMQLQPESLGEVKMEVSLEANKVSARFKVENSSVKQTLNGSMEQLKQSLQQMGLDVDGVEVSDMSAEEGGNEEQWFDDSRDGEGRGRGGPGGAEDVEEGAVDEETRRRRLREYSTIELVA